MEMTRTSSSFSLLVAFVATVFFAGCTDQMIGPDAGIATSGDSPAASSAVAPTSEVHPKLRFPHLLDKAISTGVAGKDGPSVHLYLAFNEYEADGVTRRVMDSYGVTRRIMEEYGVTRRVLDSYGITRRVLEEYGVTRRVLDSYGVTRRVLEDYGVTRRILQDYATITDALLTEWGITWAQLEGQGVTRRVLDDYGVTRRVLDDYNVTLTNYEEALAAFDSVLRVRLRVSKTRPGISISFGNEYLDAILEELYTDPDVDLIDPDYQMENRQFDIRRGFKESNEMIPWSVARIGGVFTQFDSEKVHVYVLDSGVFDRDLNLVEKKDFTMLFQNRDVEFMDEEEIVQLDVFDPGDQGDWNDKSGHGSHVSGIIGAKRNDDGIRGVARGVKLHSLKVLTDEGKTDLTTVMAAVDYVTDQKQRNPLRPTVMNLSLGMDLGSGAYNALDEAIQRAISNGVVVVVSAGNDAADAATYSPAHVREAITVGAYDEDGTFSAYSNHGSAVDILAPGTDVVSLTHLPAEAAQDENVLMSGTSHAAPHVAGAAALYLALNNTATPAQVKQALINAGRTGVAGVPMGTGDRMVYVGGFAGDGLEKAFSVLKAEWKDGSRIVLEGEGERLADVEVFNPLDGSLMGSLTITEQGQWVGSITPNGAPPCTVSVRSAGQSLSAGVYNAPVNCLKPFALDKATWHKKNGLTVKGDGLAGRTVTLFDDGTGVELATTQIDATGGWEFSKLDANPCVVRATDGEDSGTTVVEGVNNCATADGGTTTNFVVDKIQYGPDSSGKMNLKIKGATAPFERLSATNSLNGFKLGEWDADDKGSFEAEWSEPGSVPCDITVTLLSTGGTVAMPVDGAPIDCVGGFRLADAYWDGASQWLHVIAVGTPYAPITIKNGRNDSPFHFGQIDATGRFEKAYRNLAFVPCSVSVESEGEVGSLPVRNAPSNCDVNTIMNTLQWSDEQWFLSLGGSGTPGLPLTVYNADTESEIEKVVVDNAGNWRLDLNLIETPVPPCNVAVHGANGDVINAAVSASMCNADFVYREPGSTWEQNPYSFVAITKAQYDNGTLVVEGDGYVFMRVDLSSTNTGGFVGQLAVDTNEEWALSASNLGTVPCSITATLDGRTVTRAVDGAPLNCDGRDYLVLSKAEYDAGKNKLVVEGTGLPASGSADIEIRFSDGTPIGTVTPDSDGDFQLQLTGMAAADSPCGFIDAGFVGGASLVDNYQMGKSSSTCLK